MASISQRRLNARPLRTLGIACAATCLLSSGLVLAHDDDPKLLHRRPPIKGSGFARGLANGAQLTGGGTNSTARGSLFDSVDITLHAWLTLGDLGGANSGNDIWGYVSPSGREYALVGIANATVIVEVSNPDIPMIVESIAGPNGLWRDIRVHEDIAYSVSEAGSGIQVIDLSDVDNGNVTLVQSVTTGGSAASHNVVVDNESGFLYRCGGSGGGLRIYDLSTPNDPVYVASWSSRYVHDAQVVTYTSGPYAGKQIAFCCGGLNGGWVDPTLTVLDVTDKLNIIQLAQVSYPGREYSHQGILSEDRQLYYLGDELDEDGTNFTTTHVFDVSDLANTTYMNAFDNGSHAVGHNMFTTGGLLYQANYTDGLRIFDATTDPLHPTEIGFFDTTPQLAGATYNGLWGVYPFLPSGTILCNDIDSGFYVLSYTPTLGEPFCSPPPNSTGAVGAIEGSGSILLADNNVTLVATDLPADSFGYFLVSPNREAAVPPAGAPICVGDAGANIGRYLAQVGNTGSVGQLTLLVDVMAVPQPTGAVAIQPGETWHFQCWHRDAAPGGGATSNLTSGYSIHFH